MAVNHKSGRVVVEVEPALKLSLHAALAADGLSLKDWFVQHASEYVTERQQPRLAFVAEPAPPAYRPER